MQRERLVCEGCGIVQEEGMQFWLIEVHDPAPPPACQDSFQWSCGEKCPAYAGIGDNEIAEASYLSGESGAQIGGNT